MWNKELILWLADNVHEKMTPLEFIHELSGAGFTASEVNFLIKEVSINETFRFKTC